MDARAFIRGTGGRLARAILSRPRPRDWLELAVAAAVLAMVAGPVGFWTGLLAWRPKPAGEIATLALSALFVPALGEELPFRAALIPDRTEASRAGVAIVASMALFSLWHVVEAAVILPKARTLFLRPDFLAWTVALGLACAMLRRRSGSLWPPVLLHWLAVVAWQGWLGGPGLKDLG